MKRSLLLAAAKRKNQAAPFAPSDILMMDGRNGGAFTARDSAMFQDAGDEIAVTAVDDPIDGTITDIGGRGNDFSGSGCVYNLDANGYPQIDTVDNAGHVSFSGLATLPTNLTIAAVLELATDNLGYFFSDKGENKGIGLFLENNTNTGHGVGFTATVEEISFNGKVYDNPTWGALHKIMKVSGKCVVIYKLSNVSGTTIDFGIGNNNAGSNYSTPSKVTAGFWVDDILTSEETANLINYFGGTYGRDDLTGSPKDIDVLGIWGQSDEEGRSTDLHAPAVEVPLSNRSINFDRSTKVFQFPIVDPVSTGTLGSSMVPALAVKWKAVTGRPICAVMGAVGGTYLLPEATSHWGKNGGTDGASRAILKTWVNDAIALLDYHADFVFHKLFIIGGQGKSEVLSDNSNDEIPGNRTITPALYEDAYVNLADDLASYFTGLYGSKFAGQFDFLNSPRYEDSSELAMQFVDFVARNNQYNDAKLAAAARAASLTIIGKGSSADHSIDQAVENVHIDRRAQQERAAIASLWCNSVQSEPVTPVSPFISSELFLDNVQANKSEKLKQITIPAETVMLGIAASAHLFASGSGQLHLHAEFNGMPMHLGGSIETENTGEVASAFFYLHKDAYGADLEGVTGFVEIFCRNIGGGAKIAHQIHIAPMYIRDGYRAERVEGNIDLHNATTAAHDISPVIGSFVLNVTAANYNAAAVSAATIANLTEIHDAGVTYDSLSKTSQIAISHGVTDAEVAISPSVAFDNTMDELAPFSTTIRRKWAGEVYVAKQLLELAHNFFTSNAMPEGFTMVGGPAAYNAGGLDLSGSGQYFERTIDGDEIYLDLSKPGYAGIVYAPDQFSAVDDQWLFSINAGTSTPQIAMRIYRGDGTGGHNTARMFVYPDAGNTTTNYGKYESQVGVFDYAILVWESGGEAKIITESGETIASIGTITPGNYSKIRFGDDHNGGAEFDGTIPRIVIGQSEKPLTMRQAIQKVFIDGDVPILVEGQSYNSQNFGSAETSEPVGQMAATKQASEILDAPNKIFLINGTNTGSALLSSSDAADAWLDNSGEDIVQGDRQLESEIAVFRKGLDPVASWWAQYQGDVFDIAAGNTTLADYKAGMEWKIARNKALWGDDFVMLLEIPGARNEAVTESVDAAHQDMRELYFELIAENEGVIGVEGYDIEPFDTTGHPTNAGHQIRAPRAIRRILGALGKDMTGLSTTGPSASVTSASGTAVVIDITHDQGAVIVAPASNYEGFKVFETDGTEIAISAAVKTSDTRITLTLASTPSGAQIDIKYPFGALEGVTLSELVYDDSAETMPLQSFVQRVTVT